MELEMNNSRVLLTSLICPIRVWSHALAQVPDPSDAPAFLITPLMAYNLTPMLRSALERAGVLEAARFTIHGLRQEAAQAMRGVRFSAIIVQGTWECNVVYNYIPCRAPFDVL